MWIGDLNCGFLDSPISVDQDSFALPDPFLAIPLPFHPERSLSANRMDRVKSSSSSSDQKESGQASATLLQTAKGTGELSLLNDSTEMRHPLRWGENVPAIEANDPRLLQSIVNLSGVLLTNNQLELLSLGLNFHITP